MNSLIPRSRFSRFVLALALAVGALGTVAFVRGAPKQSVAPAGPHFSQRQPVDTSGFSATDLGISPWEPDASLGVIAARWDAYAPDQLAHADAVLADPTISLDKRCSTLQRKATFLSYKGDAQGAYAAVSQIRELLDRNPADAPRHLYTIIFLQGVSALRLGENENCVNCRGVSACILPLAPTAVHTKQKGSRLAVGHFTEYLNQFPDDMEVRWLLNLAHMTLGEHPAKVDPRFVISMNHFAKSEFDVGQFQDIAHLVGLSRTNMAGGALMDDFDNDGRLDFVTTSYDARQSMAMYKNTGDGGFEEITASAGLSGQLGGLNCVQTDYNNDGLLDIFVCRGAWQSNAIRSSLLRNQGNNVFTDVTHKAGLQDPVNTNSGLWADYDNDGHLDLFVCCERQPSKLYHNQGDGTFKDVAATAGLLNTIERFCKGATWVDYDNDGNQDLFLNFIDGMPHLFHNDGKGNFSDVTGSMGIKGPNLGFSCWTFDYDNDGWQDLFSTCYERSMEDVVHGLLGKPFSTQDSRLYRNVNGKRFEDVTATAGLDQGFTTMGSNFGDVDNDGFLDMYLGTGSPDFGYLVPNRMLKNVGGKRFSEITGTSRTGHLQKGHGVAFGDWDRDGNVDLFVELGGAVPGDRYHNVLFQNPGHSNQWLTLKLQGKKTNRAAIGARIKVVTAGKTPQTIYRTVTSGSSFGANPLQQTIGLGRAERVATLEIRWPVSDSVQVFRDVAVNQALEVTELTASPRPLDWKKLPTPKLAKRSGATL